jgi:uncharacterized protein YecT (DUF1311 family)
MIRRVVPAALAAVLLAPWPVAAEMFGDEYRACQERARDPQVLACLAGKTKAWEAKLATELRALPARLDRDQRASQAKAQQAWEKYRDANCAVFAARDGSIRTIQAAECRRAMTEARAADIARLMRED